MEKYRRLLLKEQKNIAANIFRIQQDELMYVQKSQEQKKYKQRQQELKESFSLKRYYNIFFVKRRMFRDKQVSRCNLFHTNYLLPSHLGIVI